MVSIYIEAPRAFCVERTIANERVFTQAAETFESISVRRKNTENRIERLFTDLTERVIDRDEYEYMKEKYSQQLKTLSEAEREAAAQNKAVREKLSDAEEWLCTVEKYRSLPALTPDILKLLVKEILIHGNRSVTVVFNFSDQYKSVFELQSRIEGAQRVG